MKMLWKDTFRSIGKSWTRFISILLIILLGVAFYVGISATGPDMLASADAYYREQQLMDQKLTSYFGFTTQDLEDLASIEDLELQGHYTEDVTLEGDQVLSFVSYSADQEINKPLVVEGRLPESSGEIALDATDGLQEAFELGDTVRVQSTHSLSGEDSPLKTDAFKVVGFVNSPLYIDENSRGQTHVGAGFLEGFAYIPEADFNRDSFNRIYVNDRTVDEFAAYSPEYEAAMEERNDKMADRLQDLSDQRQAEEIANLDAHMDEIRADLEAGESSLEELQAIPEGVPLPPGTPTVEEVQADLDEGYAALDDLEQAKADLSIDYQVTSRSDQPGYEEYGQNADRITAISKVFPVFFFLIATLVSYSTMTRMVNEGTTQMGTMKALGYSKFQISFKYLVYALLAGLTGTILGLAIGYYLFPTIIFDAYSSVYNIPDLLVQGYPLFTTVAVVFALLATVGATAITLFSEVKKKPVDLLNPAPPKGKSIFLERFDLFWDNLSFNWKISLRNMFRYKGRMFMTIFGVAGCTALMLMGFGISDSVNDIRDDQYQTFDIYEAQVVVDSEASDEDLASFEETLENAPLVEASLPIHQESADLYINGSQAPEDLQLIAANASKDFSSFKRLYPAGEEEAIPLENSGIYLTEKMAENHGLQPGNQVTLVNEAGLEVQVPIAAIIRNYTGHKAYLSTDLYRELYGQVPTYNSRWLLLNDTSDTAQDELESKLIEEAGVLSIIFTKDVQEKFNESLQGLDVVVIVLVVSAALLAFVVLYNLSNINVSERQKELSTVKVLGFYDHEVTMYVYRENILLTLIGILLGFIIGYFLHRYIILTVEFNDLMFGRTIHLSSYVYSSVLTLVFSLIVMLVMHFVIKKIDQVEALKADD